MKAVVNLKYECWWRSRSGSRIDIFKDIVHCMLGEFVSTISSGVDLEFVAERGCHGRRLTGFRFGQA